MGPALRAVVYAAYLTGMLSVVRTALAQRRIRPGSRCASFIESALMRPPPARAGGAVRRRRAARARASRLARRDSGRTPTGADGRAWGRWRARRGRRRGRRTTAGRDRDTR